VPKEILNLNDFSAGLIDNSDPRDIPLNALAEANHVSYKDRSSIKITGGGQDHNFINPSFFSGFTAADGSTGDTSILGHIAGGYGVYTFESDFDLGYTAPASKNASGATDSGSKYVAIVDCLTARMGLYDYTSRTFNLINGDYIPLAGGNASVNIGSHSFGTDKLAFNVGSTTGGVRKDNIVDDDSTFITKKIKANDYIRVEGSSDNSNANNFQCLRVREVSRNTITLDHLNVLTSDSNEAATIYTLIKPVFYYADNALRVSDESYFLSKNPGSETNPNHPKNTWFGYIKRNHFINSSNGDSYLGTTSQFDSWDFKDPQLTAPTATRVDASGITHVSANTGFSLSLEGDTALSTSGFVNSAYQIASTFIYDGNQESLLFVPSSNHTFTPSGNNRKLQFKVGFKAPYNSRLTGGRIYARLNDTEDEWFLLIDIDLSRGVRTNLTEPYTSFDSGSASGTTEMISDDIFSSDINLETYEILNGFTPNEKKIDIGGYGEGYKTALITNRRAFIANVRTQDDNGVVVQMRDRIMYSPVGKFDTFPRSFFIDVVRGDAGEFIKLESIGDRLLAFKQEELFIINIASQNPVNWFLEGRIAFAGCNHSSAVVKTSLGVIWANKYGFNIFDGNNVTNLVTGKISEDTWSNFFTNGTVVGYNPLYNYAILVKDTINNDTSNEASSLIYDFKTQAWSQADGTLNEGTGSGSVITNLIPDYDNNITYGHQIQKIGSDTYNSSSIDQVITVKEWEEDNFTKEANQFNFVTKDLDFGSPGRKKRVYAIYITFKSGASHTDPVSFAIDGSNTFTTLTGDFSASSTYTVVKLVPASKIQCVTFRLKVKNTSAVSGTDNTGIVINNISIEYRTSTKRIA